ncbi:nuclear transport factor 2 family protein [Aquimarina sp. 2304DJ70-9]|uniref:nuclear transport factor 2 family protein n=1 Tax=Aquimarina penaris TaxID=3231044 RepID=UPI003462622C
MNKEHPNIGVLKRFNPANIAASAEVLSEDAVFHFFNPELPEVEGDYLGLKGFMDFFKKMAGNTGGSFKVNPVSITPMGDELVVTHVKDTMVLKGKSMEIDAVVVWRIIDGKIKEAWDIPAVYTAKVLNHNPERN